MNRIFAHISFNEEPVEAQVFEQASISLKVQPEDKVFILQKNNAGFFFTQSSDDASSSDGGSAYSEDYGISVIADARIDNKHELIHALGFGKQGRAPEFSDVEFIRQAYLKWNTHCVDHLIGDFSFAVYDLDRQKLFCARDHFGIKPFFYTLNGGLLYLSNSLNCLKKILYPALTIDRSFVADYLLFGFSQDLKASAFEEIRETWTV